MTNDPEPIEPGLAEPSINERWLGAICYLSFLVFIPILVKSKSPFLVKHCRQGFVLFFVEVTAAVALRIFDFTIGRIPLLGFVISILLYFVVLLALLILSVLGFVKALSGEDFRLPFLDELADRVPIH
jgi:uncharacterized membrane protein